MNSFKMPFPAVAVARKCYTMYYNWREEETFSFIVTTT